MINISSDIVTAISGNVASIIQQLWIVFALLIGIVLSFFIIRKLIYLFTYSK